MRHRHTPITPTIMLKSEVDAILNTGKNVKQQLHSFIALGNAKWYSHSGRQFSNSLQS